MGVDCQEDGEADIMTRKKRTSLDSVFQGDAGEASASPKTTASSPPPTKGKRPGIKQQTAYLPLPVYQQLRRLAFEEEQKMHDLLMEGLDRVFADRGLPSIKEITKES